MTLRAGEALRDIQGYENGYAIRGVVVVEIVDALELLSPVASLIRNVRLNL
jgi:hypothetical protein